VTETTTTPANPLAQIAALTLPDSAAVKQRAERTLQFIDGFVIDSDATYQLAAEELAQIKAKAKRHEELRTSITGPINKALDTINALFKGPAQLLEQAEAMLKSKMLAYTAEQERIAREARERAEALAAAERARLAALAAAAEREAQAQAQAAAAAAAAGDAQAEAVAAAAAQRAQAEAVQAATVAQMVVAPVIQMEATKARGVTTRNGFDFEVTDLAALVKHVAEHPEHANFLAANLVALRNHIKAVGPTVCKLPGVKVVPTKSLASRAA
jgi:hypothetical protein